MNPPERLRNKCRASLWAVSFVVWASYICVDVPDALAQASPSPTSTVLQASESLKGKSNEELVHLLVGGKSTRKLEEEARRANEVKTHLPDRFWEMPPRDAVLALVQDNCNLKKKPQLRISLRDYKGPPDKGKVELRLKGGYFGMEWEGLTRLSSDRAASTLEISHVEMRGPVNRAVVERAIRQTTRPPLRGEEARRLYEIIWWLGRVQFTWPDQDTAPTEWIVATHSVRGEFTVQPRGPRKQEITLCPRQLGECYYETFTDDLYASFVDFIFRETLKRHGVDLDKITAVLGKETFSSEEEKFVYTSKPPPPNDPSSLKWIDRMLKNLDKYRFSVITDLVSFEEPLRYSDSRIDDALFRLLRSGLSARSLRHKSGETEFGDAAEAGHALARRKRPEAFPLIMEMLSAGNDDRRYAREKLLKAATLLASTKPEYRQKLVEYVTTQMNELSKSSHSSYDLFDSVWRGNLREMMPILEKMATASPDEVEDDSGSSSSEPPPTVRRYHGARRILTAWRESDPPTKLKLDAIIETSTAFGAGPAEFLQKEFAALPEDEQRKFKDFVRWLEEQRPKDTSWNPRPLEKVFSASN